MTLVAVSTMRFDDPWLDAVRARVPDAEIVQHPAENAADLPPGLLARADVLYTASCFPGRMQAPRLRWVQLDTSGVDHVVASPLWGCEEIAITTIGGISPRPIAGYVLAMVLAFAHHLPAILEHQGRREWPPFDERWARFMPARLDGATMVVVGFGRLGRQVAATAEGFGIRVIGVRRGGDRPGERLELAVTPRTDRVLTVDRLHEALTEADQVVVTTPYTPATHHLIDAAAFAALRPGAVLVNVARGGVVDEDALLAALDSGQLAGAALDVFATEPLPLDSPLWTHPRVIVSPHVAGFAPDYRERVGDLFADNLERLVTGRPLLNLVDRGLRY